MADIIERRRVAGPSSASDGVSTTTTAKGVGRTEYGAVGLDGGEGEGVRQGTASMRLLMWEDRVPRSIGLLRIRGGEVGEDGDAMATGEALASSSTTASSKGEGVAWDTAGITSEGYGAGGHCG